MATLTLRNVKGTALTYQEGDSNYLALDSDSPWNVADGRIFYTGRVGIGPNSSNPTYHLDFGSGVSNEATIGTRDADMHFHVDGARKFKVSTNGTERVTMSTTGKFGIGQTNPQFELDVGGYANVSNTLYANNVEANSFTDGTLSISGGSILNAKRIVSTTQIDFTQLYDRSTALRINQIDSELTTNADRLPTSFAVKVVTSQLSARLDSDNLYFTNRLDSEHAWANNNFTDVNLALDSEHAWANNYFNQHQANIDSVNSSLITHADSLQYQIDSLNGKLEGSGLQAVTDIEATTTNTIQTTASVETSKVTGNHQGNTGLEFQGTSIAPLNNSATLADNAVDLGSSTYRFKQGFFSDTVVSGDPAGTGTRIFNSGAVYALRAVKDTNDVWRGYGAGAITSNIDGSGNQTLKGNLSVGADAGSVNKIATFSGTDYTALQQDGPDFAIRLQGNVNTGLSMDIATGSTTFPLNIYAHSLMKSSLAGISFEDNTWIPVDNTETYSNGTVDLGKLTGKFKDGYFSGTVTAPSLLGDLSGNADTATTLQTARNINGTSFNGSANITTAQWGTARNISIGGTAKSVNGSTNYSWSTTEIGITKANIDALGINATSTSGTFTVQGTAFNGSANKTVTFSGGTGIGITGTTITNTAPDQTVSIASGTGITTSGTYPNFTVTNSAPDQTVSLTGAGGLVVSGSYPNFTLTQAAAAAPTAGNGISVSAPAVIAMTGSFTGSFTATGDIVAFSDVALKSDINPITAALEKVSQIGGYTYLKDGDDQKRTGVLAQEIQKVLPEAVHTSEDGILGVAYGNLTGLLIEAVKELNAKVKDLESKLGV